MRGLLVSIGLLSISSVLPGQPAADSKPLRLAIAGLVHGHVDGFFRATRNQTGVQIVGIFDPDTSLHQKYAEKYALRESLFFTELETMLDRVKPEAVASFTNTYDHPMVVEACSRRHLHVMMEKPLAVNMEHAHSIQRAANRGNIQVIVNYETTWYPSHGAMWNLFKVQHAAGDINRMVAMDGHQGPKEIHVGPEFLNWLTDPVKNGAGALFDFGCYGANLMTWMMDNERPLAVTALTQQVKPETYKNVDDQASILLEYRKAQGIIQASWNWPFNRKDFEVYGANGYAIAVGGDVLRVRLPGGKEEAQTPPSLAADDQSSISYLRSIVRDGRKPSGLSSLENNMIVTEILEAARESARTGKAIRLSRP